jgi:hypothetical protein
MIDEQAHLAKLAQLSPEELTAANRRLLAEVEQQLQQLSELRQEYAEKVSEKLGIAPSEIGRHLEQSLSPSELAHHRQQFEKEFGPLDTDESEDSSANHATTATTARRPGPRRNIV